MRMRALSGVLRHRRTLERGTVHAARD